MAMVNLKIPGFNMAEKLGSGSYSDVYKAYNNCNSKEVVAIKCIDKSKLSKTGSDNVISEIKILKKLHHEHIVELKDFSYDDSYIYLIMEYCSGGSLSHYIQKHQRLPENLCQRFLQQLVKALKYLRDQNISHFDLKPQNILITSKRLEVLKIGDFGLAQFISDGDTTSLIKGSPLYMAPEIVLAKQYDARADIWSVGIILYECLFGKAPYSSKSFEELINKIKEAKPIVIPNNSNISSECCNFLENCLERDVNKRFCFDDFFSHPFINLKYAPGLESLDKASHHLHKAFNYEKIGYSVDAFNSYNEALKYLLPLSHVEKNSMKRMQLKKKITEYVTKMEVLKSQNHSEDIQIVKSVDIPSNIGLREPAYRPSRNFNINISELLNLTKTTPNMTAAVEIALSGELYEKEKNYSFALENYELALGELLNLLKTEPKGRRKELLLVEMKRWMDSAEYMKTMVNTRPCLKNVSEADMEKNCCIQ